MGNGENIWIPKPTSTEGDNESKHYGALLSMSNHKAYLSFKDKTIARLISSSKED